MNDRWPNRALAELVNLERRSIYELLATLSAEQLSLPSLCELWTIRDVACHMASSRQRGSVLGTVRMFRDMYRSGGSWDEVNQGYVEEWRREGNSKILSELRRPLRWWKIGWDRVLVEVFLHGQDVRLPLGVVSGYSDHCLRVILDGTPSFVLTGADQRIQGLHLRATDIDWEFGSGPEVEGPAEALILALNGRKTALARLSGDGVSALAARHVDLRRPGRPRAAIVDHEEGGQ
ncbi:MAG: maleylpyruvate isomerase family mycothiol-dependent enzyme [Candidatus Dormibacteria bacterium]